MAFGPDDKKFEYNVQKERVFDEKGSTFLAMRQIAWGVHWELRRWRMRDGKEIADKGFSFLTEEGPHELTNALLSEGFGRTKDVLTILRKRDDFKETVENMANDGDATGEYFDPRAMLMEEDDE